MSGKNLHKTLVGVIAAAAICGTTFTTPAAAKSPGAPSGDAVSSSSTAARAPISSDLRVKILPNGRTHAARSELAAWGGDPRVRAYWTVKRMRSAIPLDTPRSTAAVQKEVEKLSKHQGSPTPLKTMSSPAAAKHRAVTPKATPVTNFSATNGKVYFTNRRDGLRYVCSGSAVNSGSRRLVITAGHCVHGGRGGTWHANWEFVPAYHRGARPYGTFQAYRMRTYDDWINYGESGRGYNSDVGFVTTFTNASGRRVVDAVGGHGTRYGGSRAFDASIFGYPANLDRGQVCGRAGGPQDRAGSSISRRSTSFTR